MRLHFFKDTKLDNYVIIASLKNEHILCKLINRIPGSCLFKSSLPCSASRMHVELFGKPRDLTCVVKIVSMNRKYHKLQTNHVAP